MNASSSAVRTGLAFGAAEAVFLLKYLLMPLLSFSCRSASSSRFRFAERECQHNAMTCQNAILLLLTCFAVLRKTSITIAIVICLLFVLPILATIVCVSLAIVVNHEVVLI